MCHQRRERGELQPKFRERAGCEYNSETHACYGLTGQVVRGTGTRGPGKNSECRIFFSMAEDEGRCVYDSNIEIRPGDRLVYTLKPGATAMQCLQKCMREKGTITTPNVYGCEYQSFASGTVPRCEAITEPFKGGDGTKPPFESASHKRICWTLLKLQAIKDYLLINRNPRYCNRYDYIRSPKCVQG